MLHCLSITFSEELSPRKLPRSQEKTDVTAEQCADGQEELYFVPSNEGITEKEPRM